MNFVQACKVYNDNHRKGQKYLVPKRGTKEYNEVRKLMTSNKVSCSCNNQEGEGIKEVVEKAKTVGKNLLDLLLNGPRTNYPPKVRQMIKQHGEKKITSISVARSPIQAIYKKVINIILDNKMEENRKKLNYDDIFHLYLIITLDDGTILRLEKNQVISMKPYTKSTAQEMQVPYKGNLLLGQLLINGQKSHGQTYFTYDSIRANCQIYVYHILKGSKLINKQLETFILQDAPALISNDTKFEKTARTITNLASIFDQLIEGRGIQAPPARRRPKSVIV